MIIFWLFQVRGLVPWEIDLRDDNIAMFLDINIDSVLLEETGLHEIRF